MSQSAPQGVGAGPLAAYPALIEAKDLLDRGLHERAAYLAVQHLRTHPGEPRGLALLGSVAVKTGALQQGENFFRQALKRGNKDISVCQDLATCLHQQERIIEALDMWQELRAERPDDPRAIGAIAFIYDKLDRGKDARELWRELTDRYPRNAPYLISYGLNLRAAGRTEDSVRVFQDAVKIDPERGEAWWALASVKGHRFTASDLAAMHEAVETALDLFNLAPLHFALGRAYQTRKDIDRAFHHFSEANRLWAEAINYSADELTTEVAEASTTFDRAYFDKLAPGGAPSDAPIFIVSLPRSGSTLLEQMLGCHEEIEPLGELPYVPALLRSVMERATQRGRVTVPQTIAGLSPADRTLLGEEYLRRAAAHRLSESSRFADKLPHNWNNVLFIRHILPNARFIDIRRSPISCCFANFTHSFTRAHASSFALDHIGRAYSDYVRLMDQLDEAAPDMVHHVRYEELIETPEPVLRAALDYLDLPWDDALLRFYESDRNVRTPSAEQVRRPLNREGIGAWKPYRQWLGPLFEALGPLAEPELAEADRG